MPAISPLGPCAGIARREGPVVSRRLLHENGSHLEPSGAAMTICLKRWAALQYGQSAMVSNQDAGISL